MGAGPGCRFAGEDLLVGLLDGGARFRAELVDEAAAQPVVDGEGLGLAAGPVQGQHEPPVEALAEGVFRRQGAERGDGLVVAAEPEFGVEAPFEGLEAGLRELVDPECGPLGVGEGGQVGEGCAAPQGHGERGLAPDLLPVLPPVGVPYGPDAGLEHVGVELVLVDEQLVTGGHGAQPLLGPVVQGGEDAAQPGEVVGEGGVGAGSTRTCPRGPP